jgi:hypothetical protein
VAAVLPYIQDPARRRSVEYQLARFRKDQALYARESAQAGYEWALFDLELARSLKTGVATKPLMSFIIQNAGFWNTDSRENIDAHLRRDGSCNMTTALAALLARAKQKLIGDELSVVTGNEAAIGRVSNEARERIRINREAINFALAMGANAAEVYRMQQEQYSLLHRQSITSGGGCPGEVASAFGGSRSFNCPNPKCRRENYRPIRDELLPKCLHCGTDVSCKPPEPAPAKHQNSESPTWEKMLGVRPVELKTKVGERALVGAGK